MWYKIYRTKDQLATLFQFGIPLFMLASLVLLVQGPGLLPDISKDPLALAFTIDFLITVPFVHYLLIRKTKRSKFTVFTFFVLGLVTATVFLPADASRYLSQFKFWVLPFIELTVLSLVIRKVVQVRRAFRKGDTVESKDFLQTLKMATKAVLPPVVSGIFATEISLFYYIFKGRYKALSEKEFTYHKRTGTVATLSIFLFLIALETFLLHLVISRWNLTVAWVLTAISAYTWLQVLGIIRSVANRRIRFEKEGLHLNYGLMSDVTIPYDLIEVVEEKNRGLEFKDGTRQISPLGELEKYNMVIRLSASVEMELMYGMKRKCDTIAFFVDEKEKFAEALKEITAPTNSHS